MYEITRLFEFDAAHRPLNHESKCKHLHGHHYVAEVSIGAHGLDTLDRVIDFAAVKAMIGGWIDSNWHHNTILCDKDPMAAIFEDDSVLETNGRAPYLLVQNPTAEVLAKYLFEQASFILPSPLVVQQVKLYETPKCYAIWRG